MGCVGTMMDGMGMMMWFSFLLGLLLIVLIVVAVVATVRWLRGEKPPLLTHHREDAVETLKKRYARGEISKDEYEKIRKISSDCGRNTKAKPLALISVVSLIFGLLFLYGSREGEFPVVQAAADTEPGKRLYLQNCAACHGEKGDGRGPEAHRLRTKPRDFTTGIYKFRSTRSGSLPTDHDIFRTISQGVRTTSMLAQLHLSENERWAVTAYIKTFSARFKVEKPSDPIPIPAEPSPTRDLITLGKRLYADAGCAECHGTEGRGDGPSAKELKDEAGNRIYPADLTVRPFKSGSQPQDLYRTISTGFNGTPMPSYTDALAPKERWAIVSYILSIATHERPRGMMGLVGEEIDGMHIDMRAAMAGMMGGRGMMRGGGGMMNRDMRDMMKDMMGR